MAEQTPHPFGEWTLKTLDGIVLAQIVDCDVSQPWYIGTLIPEEGFSDYAPMFLEQTRIVNSGEVEKQFERLEELLQYLNQHLQMVLDADGKAATTFMMNIYDQEAWIRADFEDEG